VLLDHTQKPRFKGGSMRENSIAGSGLCGDGDWVAVQVRLNRERFVAQQLQMYGYDQFLPVATAARGKAARARECSLVPGYVFCRYKVRPDFRIVQAYGVMRIVGFGGAPVAIPEDEIDALRRVIESGVQAEPCRFIKSGDRVQVCAGPLSGLEGILLHVKKAVRVLVNVTILQRSVAVELGIDDVRPVEPHYHAPICSYSLQPAHI
jgi:transcriptional antiterminator RfaH